MSKTSSHSKLSKLVPFTEIVTKGVSFLCVLIITKLVSVEEFGSYYYIIAIVTWASVLMDGGIGYFIVNESVQNRVDNVGSYITTRILFSFFTILILSIFILIYDPESIAMIWLYAISLVFILMVSFLKIIARTQQNTTLDLLLILLEPILRLAFLFFIFTLYNKVSLHTIFFLLIASSTLSFIISYFKFNQFIPIHLDLKDIISKMIQTLKTTKWYLIMYLFIVGLKRIEVIIINAKLGDHYSGLYSSADNFYNAAYLFFTSLVLVGIKKHFEKNKKDKIKNVLKLFVGGLLMCIGLLLFSEILFTLFYPKEYFQGYKLLQIMSLSLIFTPLNFFFILDNNYKKRTEKNAIILGGAFLLKIILMLVCTNFHTMMYIAVGMDFAILLFFISLNKKNFLIPIC